ncbi:hypothetical protein BJX61DRAFT_443789 [Aspergillus egyptiacus]|nr:hypothetical protein BJX61DRAFT_443789 [Aspergillus egyptiacus]
MRSGLRKPGTVSLLALLIFALLTLVPTVAKDWELNSFDLGYLGPPRSGSRHSSPRVKNAIIESQPRVSITESHCKSWLLREFYPFCSGHDAHPPDTSLKTPPRSSYEAGVSPEKEFVTQSAEKEPSSITRGVSAFKDFVIKRWDDQQTIRPLPPRYESGSDELPAHPTLTPADRLGTPTLDGPEFLSTPCNNLDATLLENVPGDDSLLHRVPSFLHETWQQVCHTGGHYFESFTTRSPPNIHPEPLASESLGVVDARTHSDHSQTDERPQSERERGKGRLSDGDSTLPNIPLDLENTVPVPTLSPDPGTTAGQYAGTELRANPMHMRGSTMAVVVGLAVGVIWF